MRKAETSCGTMSKQDLCASQIRGSLFWTSWWETARLGECRSPSLVSTCPTRSIFTIQSSKWQEVNSSWFRYIHHMDVCIYIYISWAAVKINCLRLVQKYRLSPLFLGGPIALQHLVQISTKYYNNAAKLRFIKISKKLLFIKMPRIGFIKDFKNCFFNLCSFFLQESVVSFSCCLAGILERMPMGSNKSIPRPGPLFSTKGYC